MRTVQKPSLSDLSPTFLRTFGIGSILVLLLILLPAASSAQEKARLVNPKKKTTAPKPAPEEAEAAPTAPASEPAPAKATRAAKKAAKKAAKEAKKAEAASSASAPAATRSAATSPAAKSPAASATSAAAPAEPAAAVADRSSRDVEVRETVNVREVLLDVLVTDRKGNVVTGLSPEDFVVMEEGQEVPVSSLTFYGSTGELQGSGREGETRTDRYFILLFDDQRQVIPQLMPAQMDTMRWAVKWAQEQLEPNDQVAVLGYNNRLKLYQDFTRDSDSIAQAIKKAALGKKDLDVHKSYDGPEFDPDSPSLFANLPSGKALMKETKKIQQALGLLGRAAEGIVGRKNLMFFSLGFDDPNGGVLTWTPDPRYYPDMKQSLNTGNVAVYGIDLLGSRRGGAVGAQLSDSLSSIATDTGGHYYYNFANASAPLKEVAKENQGYYLLSYTSGSAAGRDGYRSVKVKVRDGAGNGAKVRAREGYRLANAP